MLSSSHIDNIVSVVSIRCVNIVIFLISYVCPEPCTLSFVEMDKNYLQLKWNFDNRPLILHGEYIEFMCKRDAYISETSIAGSVLRVQCDRGRLKYPKCS